MIFYADASLTPLALDSPNISITFLSSDLVRVALNELNMVTLCTQRLVVVQPDAEPCS